MATKQKTSSPNYFGNLKTADANFSGGAPVNVFNATAKGARATGINLGPKGPTQAEREKAQSDATVAYNLENSPQINWSKFTNIPNDLQQSIMGIVKEKAAERGYLTHLTKNSGATDFIGKSEIASQINSNEDLIMNHIPGQLEKFSAILDGFPEDAYNNNFSTMNDPKDVTFNSNLSAGKGKYSIDENFNILVDGKSVNEIKPLEPINYKMGGQMLKTFTSAYDNGVKLSDNELSLASTNFTMALNEGGTGALLSTAFDDVMSMNGTLLNKADYQNEIAAIRGDDSDAKMQAIKKIKEAVTDAYLGRLTEQANDGFDFKQNKNNPSGPPVDIEGGINTWHADTIAGGGTPTYQDWKLEISNYKGKKEPWTSGFDLVTRSTEGSEGGNVYMQGDEEISDDELMKIFGTTQARFDSLSAEQQKELFTDNKIQFSQKEPVAGKEQVYIIPRSMVKSTQTNKLDTAFKIDPSLNKDEILRIIKNL